MKLTSKINALAIATILIGTTLILRWFGREFWCPAGDLRLWSFDVWSQHNSQHLLDWYTPSHISHGLLFCLAFRLALPKQLAPYSLSFAVLLEAGWEVLENSTFIIERYREATMALDYFGDSILNSLSDIGWCSLGFLGASRLKAWQVLIIFAALEIFTLIFIRDNLTLNVLMLLSPIEGIKEWQMGATP